MPFAFLIGLTVLACVSPLLTFARLFQLKEWRVDRLREHLRHEGWGRILLGRARPAVVALHAVGWFTFPVWREYILLGALGLLAILTLAQAALHTQAKPLWTTKALAICALSFALTCLAALMMGSIDALHIALPLLPLLEPAIVLIAWGSLLPVDVLLKRSVFERAKALRSKLTNVTVIGIAGSVGKTTTKELLSYLAQDLYPLTTPEHVNTEMGVAQWLLSLRNKIATDGPKLLIVEMGAYRRGEIEFLSTVMQPTIGILTPLGGDHLGLFGSEDEVIEANSELLLSLPKNGHAFVAGESVGGRRAAGLAPCPVTLVGIDVRAESERDAGDGISFVLNGTRFTTRLRGLHNIGNVLLAISAARHLGISLDRIRELLQSFSPLPHTFTVRTERRVIILDDTYNSSVLSVRAAIDWARSQKERPRTLLTSGILELGKEEPHLLKALGQEAKTALERVVFVHPHGANAFAEGFGEVEVLRESTQRVPTGSLLLCVGRMPLSSIHRLLPISQP